MKKIKKFLLMLSCIALVCALATGCASKEARQVISHINALGKISLESSEESKKVNSEYASLSDEDKSDVSNYSKLKKANNEYKDLKCKDLNDRIEKECAAVSSRQLNTFNKLHEEYVSLSEGDKAKISNIDLLEKSIEEAKKMYAPSVVKNIVKKANGSIDEAKSLLNEYADYMTHEQINECLIEIGRWESYDRAEDLLKEKLKNPYSFTRYSGTCTEPKLEDDSQTYYDDGSIYGAAYNVTVEIDYGATNSFGGMVRDKSMIFVTFRTSVGERRVRIIGVL